MKKLSQLLESINEVDSLLELDFKDKESFKKYQSIHKMKPTTKVNIAGKDTTVGDEMGDDSPTPQAPKKTTGADIEKQADKSGKEKDDIEKDIMGDEPKSDTSQDSEKNSRIEDKIQAKKIVRSGNVNNKIFFRKNPEGYAEQLEQTLLDIQDHADKMNDENLADEFYSEAEEQAMQVSDIANSGEGMSFDDFKQARLFIKHYEETLTGSKQSSPTSSVGYRNDRNRGGGMYDNVNPKSSTPLKELSKITTRYTNRLDEAMKMKGVNGKMVEVPSEYGRIMSGIDRLMSKFNPRGVMFGYRKYHKLKPNDEFSGSIILKNPLSKKDIDVVMKHLKSAGSSLGFKFKKITFNPDRNEPFVEFRVDDASIK